MQDKCDGNFIVTYGKIPKLLTEISNITTKKEYPIIEWDSKKISKLTKGYVEKTSKYKTYYSLCGIKVIEHMNKIKIVSEMTNNREVVGYRTISNIRRYCDGLYIKLNENNILLSQSDMILLNGYYSEMKQYILTQKGDKL